MFASAVFNFFNTYLISSDRNYMEIGVFNGDGCFQLARSHPNKIIYAIDPFIEDGCTWMHSHVAQGQPLNTQRATATNYFRQCSNIQHFDTRSDLFAESLTEQQIQDYNIGSLFIDGDHSYAGCSNDLELAMRLFGPRSGVIALDDVNMTGVSRAIEEFRVKYASRIRSENQLARLHNTVIFDIAAEHA